MSTDYTVHTHERREREREKGEKSTRERGEVRLTVTRIMADLAKVLDLFCNGEAVTAG
jgi:peptide subunit release factor 1 (eRF1)